MTSYGNSQRQSYGNQRVSYQRNSGNFSQRDRRNYGGHNFSLTDEEKRLIYEGNNELFHKKKNFPKAEALKEKGLLLSDNLFKTDRWEIEKLIRMKEKLNNTRNQLNEKDIKVWKQHTSKTNRTGRIVWPLRSRNHIEMCTNAWIKMAEIFSNYENLIPKGKLLNFLYFMH